MKSEFNLKVNGKAHTIECSYGKSLLNVLRDDLDLTGAKYGCGTGECGNCTVLMDGEPVASCIILVPQAQNHEILTIEGIRDTKIFRILKDTFEEENTFQCGYCTPGMMITAYNLLKSNSSPKEEEVRQALSGVLCRCTGYQKILRGMMKSSERLKNGRSKDE